MSNSFVAPPPISADIGIVAALPLELGFFVDRLKKVRKYKPAAMTVIEGEFEGKVVAVIFSGPGRDAARQATDILLSGHRPNLIISAGFAGGLDPSLARGMVVAPAEVVDIEGNRYPVALPETTASGDTATKRRLVTVDSIARTPAEKSALRDNYQADLVDMETSAVAAVCRSVGKRFLSARVISDDSETQLPREIATMLNRSTSYQVGAAFRAIWRRPSTVKDLWSLHASAIEASDQLAKGLATIIQSHAG